MSHLGSNCACLFIIYKKAKQGSPPPQKKRLELKVKWLMIWDETELKKFWKDYFKYLYGNDTDMSQCAVEFVIINICTQEKNDKNEVINGVRMLKVTGTVCNM